MGRSILPQSCTRFAAQHSDSKLTTRLMAFSQEPSSGGLRHSLFLRDVSTASSLAPESRSGGADDQQPRRPWGWRERGGGRAGATCRAPSYGESTTCFRGRQPNPLPFAAAMLCLRNHLLPLLRAASPRPSPIHSRACRLLSTSTAIVPAPFSL
jgi:hypothetical protein